MATVALALGLIFYEGPIHYSHYWPPYGGTNCSNFVNGRCLSATSSGEPWQKWIDRGAACPSSFPFGTIINIEGEEWTCVDRGGKVNLRNGVPIIDFLEKKPRAGHRAILHVQIYSPQPQFPKGYQPM